MTLDFKSCFFAIWTLLFLLVEEFLVHDKKKNQSGYGVNPAEDDDFT